MAFQKNQILTLSIESLSNDGSGVAHHDGQAVFVAAAAPGDVAEVRIVKPMKGYAFGKLEKLLTPGPGRVKQDCPVAGPCGGCGLRHISYAAECAAKTQFVRDAFERLAKLDVPVHEVLPAPAADRYRNKVQLPVGTDENGHLVTGFFAGRSHRIVPCTDCKLQPDWMNALAARACTLLEENGITAYNEETHTGRVRHLYMRQGWHSGQRLLCFVVNGNGLPNEAEICAALQKEFDLTTILINRNNARTNVILGAKTRVALGPGYIEDTLSGVSLRMGVHEFYQVNTPAAEALYAKAQEFAALTPDDFLLDLYCGMGTIGLSMLPDCRRLVGVEVVPQAVDGAKETAARLGLDADKADFRCQDAGAAAAQNAAAARKKLIPALPDKYNTPNAIIAKVILVALLSVGSLGVTLAAEDILGNVAGGLVILSAHPFSIGDYVEVGGVAGTVHEISLNHTKLVTPDGHLVMLPNKELASSQMTNYTVLGRRRVVQRVAASYDAPTETVKAACRRALEHTENLLEDPAPTVYLTAYKESSIEYTVYCWATPENWWGAYLALGEHLRDAFREYGVEMTYNHLNVHIIENQS